MFSDSFVSAVKHAVSLCAAPQIPGAPTGSRQDGREFERRIQNVLQSFSRETIVPFRKTAGTVEMFGHRREFDADKWHIDGETFLFEAKSAKPNKAGTDLDANAHERLPAQMARAVYVAEQNPENPHCLVVFLNGVYDSVGRRWLDEFEYVARLFERGCAGQLRIVLLSNVDGYLSFFAGLRRRLAVAA